jgi:hypothetical protein
MKKKQQKKQQKQIKMNNKPITARVKSGMFKTKEPLLNVGPAGVDGNNKTRTMPSPSKMKGYTMKSSPFKQESQAEKNVNEALDKELQVNKKGNVQVANTTIQREPDTVKPGSEKKRTILYTDLDPSQREAAKAFNQKNYGTDNPTAEGLADNTMGTGEFNEDEIVKGKETKKLTLTDLKRKNEGDAQSAYDRRQTIRASKVTGRQKKRQAIKSGRLTDKLAGIDKEKNPGKYRRIKAKLDQANDRLGVATSESENVANQSRQNIKAGSTRSTRGKALDVGVEEFNLPTGTQDQITTPTTPAEMKNTGFFKKKSPLKMNYFKK